MPSSYLRTAGSLGGQAIQPLEATALRSSCDSRRTRCLGAGDVERELAQSGQLLDLSIRVNPAGRYVVSCLLRQRIVRTGVVHQHPDATLRSPQTKTRVRVRRCGTSMDSNHLRALGSCSGLRQFYGASLSGQRVSNLPLPWIGT